MGYYYDTETGFYYLQTRYYDPTICRFINADDYELVAELSYVPGELNMYAYCGNNPIMYTDETGESFFLTALIIGLVAGATIGGTVAGVSAANSGETGWELAGSIAEGVLLGGLIGGAGGALIGLAPTIGAGLGAMMSGTASAGAVALTSSYVVAAGATAALGMNLMFSSTGRDPIGIRNYSSTRKEAYEKAFRKGKKKKPRGPELNKFGWHFHPDVPKNSPFYHWHYYF
ncbi:MAG: RHS repeat-associated core domain-containing protein [Clostridiales bacterium]|nr:RHS repeat-associated core domain-containing protein [Clostridiales bacterium]